MPIDYEKDYDNRARVPEHPEIFARWEAETRAYRAASPDAELGISYGPSQRQTIDMFPARDDDHMTPLALFIHGGWWRSLDAVVGALESSEFLRQSRDVAEGWRGRGIETRYEEIAAANHYTVVDPLTDPDSAMTRRVADLAMRTNVRAL
jgi:hypothetical protein